MTKKLLPCLLSSLVLIFVSQNSQAFNPAPNPNNSTNSGNQSSNDVDAYPGDFDPSQLDRAVQHSHAVNFYRVSPQSAQGLGVAITRASPIQGGYHGLAEWNLQWNFDYQNQGGRCSIAAVRVTLQTSILMPQLNPNQTFSASITNAFDDYYDSLLHHEKGHLTHGVLAANEVVSAIKNATPAANCRTTGNNANNAANAVIQKYNRADQRYDNETNHGATQGARL